MKNFNILTEDKSHLIRKTFPFFEKELVNELSEVSLVVTLETGQSILGEGDYIKSFPMVIDGCLRVLRLSDNGNELLLYYLNQGEICSMSLTCCMSLQKSNIRMVAEEPSIVLTIPVDKPEKWMTDYRTWKEFMMYSYKKRFDELLDTIDSIAFTQLDSRLIRFFGDRYRSTGNTIFTGTHQDIAIQLNTSREVISRLLRNLERKNLIKTERNSVDYSKLVRK
jgi:CRP/FNR family transcriptional regulator